MSAPEDKRRGPNNPPESTSQEDETRSNVPTNADVPGPSQGRSIIARIIDRNTSRIGQQFTSFTNRNITIEPSNQRPSTELSLLPRERPATSYFNISAENFPSLPEPRHSYHRRSITSKPSTSKAASSACVPSSSSSACFPSTSSRACVPSTSSRACGPSTFSSACLPSTSSRACVPSTFSSACLPSTSSSACLPSTSSSACLPSTSSRACVPSTSSRACIPSTSSTACVPSTSGATNTDKKEIIVHPNGNVSNVVSSVLNDQYGMLSILAMIRIGAPSLSHLNLGIDLNTLGIHRTSNEPLYHRFSGALGNEPLANHNMTVAVPREYLMNNAIERKLSPLNLRVLSDDTLFYLFYICIREKVQLEVAVELFNRQWRFHKDMKVWFRRALDRSIYRRIGNREEGLYLYFDPSQWQIVSDFLLICDHQVEAILNLSFCQEFFDRKHLFF